MKKLKTAAALAVLFGIMCGVLYGGASLMAGKDVTAQPAKAEPAQKPVQVKTFFTTSYFDDKKMKEINDFLADPSIEYVGSSQSGENSYHNLMIYYRKK